MPCRPASLIVSFGCVLLLAAPSRADRLVHVAGGDGPEGSPVAQAKLVAPFGVDFGRDGTMYIVEMRGGERLLDAPDDVALSAWQLEDREQQLQGFRNYLNWELGLVEQLRADTTANFRVFPA